MKRNKRTISKSGSYTEIGDFWDSHDLSDYWEGTRPVHLDVGLETERSYFGIEKELSKKISELAKKRGVPSHTLVNLMLQKQLAKAHGS